MMLLTLSIVVITGINADIVYILYIVSIDHFSLELNSVTLELSERQATFSVLTAVLL